MKTYTMLAGLLALGLGPALAQQKVETPPPPATPPEVPTKPTPPPAPDWKNAGEKKQGEKLAAEFGFTEQAVFDLRAKGLGWGEVRHALGIAQKAGQPLSEVLKLRDSGMGWGQIAQHFGFKLGDLARPEEKAKGKEGGEKDGAAKAADKKEEPGAVKADEHKAPAAPARRPSGGRAPKR